MFLFFHSQILKMANFWSSLAQLPGETEMCAHWVFCKRCNFRKTFFEAISTWSVFFAAFSPKMNLLSHSSFWVNKLLNEYNNISYWYSKMHVVVGVLHQTMQSMTRHGFTRHGFLRHGFLQHEFLCICSPHVLMLKEVP